MQCASASSSISRLRVRAMVDSSYQLRRLESDDSSPHQARKVTLGRPTSTSATRRSMSSSRPAAAALPDGRPAGCGSRVACVGSDSLFQSVVSCGVGHAHALTRGPRPPAPPDMDTRIAIAVRYKGRILAASCVPYPTGRYPHGRILYNPSDQEYNPCNDIIPPRRLEIYLRTIYDRPLTGLARTRASRFRFRAPRARCAGAWEMVCIDFIIISKLHHLNHTWWWRLSRYTLIAYLRIRASGGKNQLSSFTSSAHVELNKSRPSNLLAHQAVPLGPAPRCGGCSPSLPRSTWVTTAPGR